jgi:Domain of unknown function (DUF4926)
MFNEYDVIKTRKRLNSKVPEGSLGTVLIVHEAKPPAYIIEFMDKTVDFPTTLDVLTVREDDIRELTEAEHQYLAERHRRLYPNK